MFKVHFIFIFIIKLHLIVCYNNDDPIVCSTGWTPYGDHKCLLVVESVGTEPEAEAKCLQMNPKATLPTIKTAPEEEFVSQLLSKYPEVSNTAWIGLKWSGKEFLWADNSRIEYKHWYRDAVLDGSFKCAQMYLSGTDRGNWTDNGCDKKSLIVCQTENITDPFYKELRELKAVVEQQKTDLDKQKNELIQQQTQINQLIANPVPIGFLYTQYPNDDAPNKIWPTLKWKDITKDYAGLFFRAEGGDADKFGIVQSDNAPRITRMELVTLDYLKTKGLWFKDDIDLPIDGYSIYTFSGSSQGSGTHLYARRYLTSGGEVRPRNTAIRVWKRLV